MTRAMVEVRGLSAYAGDHVLVRDVSFTVATGQVLALVGESGSGKTTTGLALIGEARPGVRLAGAIAVDGADPRHLNPGQRPAIGYLPQHPAAALNPARRVGGVLTELAWTGLPPTVARRDRRRHAAARVAQAARTAQLTDAAAILRRFPHQLSGGQQQRTALAGALARPPKLLVLDEPTTGLDSLHRRRVLDELTDLVRHGLTAVLLTHDLAAVRELADDVVVLRDGRRCESGPVSHVLAAPTHPYTRELLAARPRAAPPAPRPAAGAGLVVTGLSASHRPGRRPVLHPLDLTVPAGTCLAVVGASGAGKSTLARCLAGLHEPDTGAVCVADERLPSRMDRRSLAQRRRVQYVFQDPHASFDPGRSVRDQVARTAVRLRGRSPAQARQEADTLLARMAVDPSIALRRPGALSGGQLQRAALARALLAEPDVLICDEVTSALDTPTQAAIIDLIAGLAAERDLILVVISHDLALVAQLADQLAVLDGGRLVETGHAAEVFATPRQPVTRALIEAARADGSTFAPGAPPAGRVCDGGHGWLPHQSA